MGLLTRNTIFKLDPFPKLLNGFKNAGPGYEKKSFTAKKEEPEKIKGPIKGLPPPIPWKC